MQTSRESPAPPPPSADARPRGGITPRAVAMVLVALLLLMSYGESLRIWVETEQQNAAHRAAIERSEQRIGELNAGLARWDDPAYVRAQARARLGWVLPGEAGYRVVGPHGEPIGGGLDRAGAPAVEPEPQTWWQRMWGSVAAADAPDAGTGDSAPTASVRPPLTDGTRTPSASPTPRRSASATATRSRTPRPGATRTPSPTPVASPR